MRYSLIYLDPPWSYNDKASAGQRGACHKYPVMSLEDMKRLDMPSIAAPDCLMAMWWVPPQPQEALDLVSAWGFTLKTMQGFTWHKLTRHGKDHFGMGNWTRANAECCLFAVRGRPKRVCAGVRSLIVAPVGRHSEKPVEARDRLVTLLGDVPRVELFARVAAPGWDAIGNDVDGRDIRDVIGVTNFK